MHTARLDHLIGFYSILDRLEQNSGGAGKLTDCSGRMSCGEIEAVSSNQCHANELTKDRAAMITITGVILAFMRGQARPQFW